MKKNALIVLSLFAVVLQAQKRPNVIKASNASAFIQEENQEKKSWHLDPKTKPDVYTSNKSAKPKWVKLYTDIDSLKIKLKPGEKHDFVVLLNQKDSCFTRFQSPPVKDFSTIKPEIHDTIPFVLSAFNNIIFKVRLNQKDTIDLKFDSGTTDFLLTNEGIKRLNLENLNGHSFQIGNQIFDNQHIYPVEVSGQGTIGRFGWNLFDGKIVEIDYDKNVFIVHSKLSKISKKYQKLDIEYTHTLFCINGELQVKQNKYIGRFLFDNGYQRTIMLDDEWMKEQKYPKDQLTVIKKVIMKNGAGKEIPVLTVLNDFLKLGQYSLAAIPVQLLSGNNPARFKTHILGNEVLKRFNTILDFQHNAVYLKPNHLWNEPYTDSVL
ncbi:hypothetical protein [Flavobacterium foetidum]|uniref:hypothetical protein n=1 Tax=Flavobacterium foetidum TaxID=2026681 RepID=UPI0010753587|nr:hypothetical protein [Flavobacterium foetidum]KAF2517146.1 hypothetical protein E0W73_03350 [Flavobacterium foetidum]